MRAERASRWFVTVSALFFVGFHVAMAVAAPRRVVVTLGLYGFVLHVLFGKAYALVPAYFDRDLAWELGPAAQFPLSVFGTTGLALAPLGPPWLQPVGTALWVGGVAVFLGTLGWTIRDNITGAATGTGGPNAHREPVDRVANVAVPIALGYLVFAAGGALATAVGFESVLPQQLSHLLAAGTAALFVFGVGFRLFPRFLVAAVPRPVVALIVAAGAIGPALLGFGLFDHRLLLVGGVVEAVAVVSFALSYLTLFLRSERRRVGFYAVLVAAAAGVVGIGLGLTIAVTGRESALVSAHYRAMLSGFLGLTVVGAAFQFYPPAVGVLPYADDRTALLSIALLGSGLGIQLLDLVGRFDWMKSVGTAAGVLGALLYTYLLIAAFARRWQS
ncbi:hypothetical protein SAMN05443574_101469 [Haloarcula vallismortis]|uniref:Uncharacterized protein n=2 Tax=Haloarcula vallismortis TaxID=28442 RepID=M0IW21_HALVA|nr:hypothetical protein [Haloarcula vallismortis]EMA01037.1 hypothetical protein C437_19622 [Haloarcula vallismortis ATCC 29715]SDW13520.1 hypothetical protein SAMN05443574_101469 [Haloarcula vallismortis]